MASTMSVPNTVPVNNQPAPLPNPVPQQPLNPNLAARDELDRPQREPAILLILKLAFFVYILTQSGGFLRQTVVILAATFIFLHNMNWIPWNAMMQLGKHCVL